MRSTLFASTLVCVLITLFNTTIVFGQAPNPAKSPTADADPAFGRRVSQLQRGASTTSLTATGLTYKIYMPETFSIFNSNTQFAFTLGGRYVTAGQATFGRQLELPQGAQLHEVTIYFVDNAAGDISFFLYQQSPDSIFATPLGNASTSGVNSSDITSVTIAGSSGSPLTTVDNAQRTYSVEMNLPSYTSDHRIHGIRIGYRYQGVFLPITPRRE